MDFPSHPASTSSQKTKRSSVHTGVSFHRRSLTRSAAVSLRARSHLIALILYQIFYLPRARQDCLQTLSKREFSPAALSATRRTPFSTRDGTRKVLTFRTMPTLTMVNIHSVLADNFNTSRSTHLTTAASFLASYFPPETEHRHSHQETLTPSVESLRLN